MMDGCKKCCMVTAVLLLLLGVLFLLVDIGLWDFWNVQWWTAVFLLMGIVGLAQSGCKNCQSMKR